MRFNTVNPPGNEEPAIRHLGGVLEAAGVAVEYQRLGPDRVNLIARLKGHSPNGALIFSGHMDVVHPGEAAWEVEPFEAVLREGRIVGRGACDMKGGVAAMAVALMRLAKEGFRPESDVVLAISAGEEVDTVGARLLASSGILGGAGALVVGEPTGLDVLVAEKGVLWVRVVAHGRSAHGSMPALGVNAISYLARVIGSLEQAGIPGEPHAILGPPTMSVNTIAGGVKTNVVADRAEATIDMRLVPGQTSEGVLAWLQEHLDAARSVPSLESIGTEIEVLQNMPPVETAQDDRLVRLAAEAVQAVTGNAPSLGGVPYGTDGAILAPALAAPMIICGPGGQDQLHQTNEYVEVSQLEQAVEFYQRLATRLVRLTPA